MIKEKVILSRCEDYNVKNIAKIIESGIQELGVKPQGRILLKPNVVISHPKFFQHTYTRPEFLEGVIIAVKAAGGKDVRSLKVGEKSGLTIPTRFAFKMAGYRKVLRRQKVRAVYFDEEEQVEIPLNNENALRPYIYIPKELKETDFLISLPKYKANPWSKVTFAIKNYIGLQEDKHRLVDHSYYLYKKIADLQEVIESRFIAIDAITAGEKNMLTPDPYQLGVIIIGTNAMTVDAVCCKILRLDPLSVDYMHEVYKRGYGRVEDEHIEILGDYPLEELQERAKNFIYQHEKIDSLNTKSNLRIYLGIPPEPEVTDYCWGGCPGALKEALGIISKMQPDVYNEVNRLHIVIGKYSSDIKTRIGEKVIFLGDCTEFSGKINGKQYSVQANFKFTAEIDPRHVSSQDLVQKIIKYLNTIMKSDGQVIRVTGCPVAIAEIILLMWRPGHTANPYLRSDIVLPFVTSYIASTSRRLVRGG